MELFDKKQKNKFNGFTLIELLIVIAIIGLLSSFIVVNLSDSTAKGRDANRLKTIDQLSKTLESEVSNGAEDLDGCTGIDADIRTCTIAGLALFSGITDPSNPIATCSGTPAVPCQYSISRADGTAGARTDNYQICFYIESGINEFSKGDYKISMSGVITSGCN